jgi:hypothetical protein
VSNRLSLRVLTALGFAGSVAAWTGCADTTGHRDGPVAQLALQPVFPETLARGVFDLAIDRVRVRVIRPPAGQIIDTLVVFPADSTQISVKLTIPLAKSREQLTVSLELTSQGRAMFTGTETVELSDGTTVAPPIPLQYIGPGLEITSLRLEPRDSLLGLGDVLRFDVRAFSGATQVDAFYAGWSTSDPTLASVDARGTLQAPDRRGRVVLRVLSPTGIKDSTWVHFSPPPTTSQGISGGGQSGIAGQPLSQLLTVIALADDRQGVPRVRVRFAALSGGRVRDTLVLTDEDGLASTSGTLGPQAGPQAFQATVPTLPAISFLTTARTGPPSLVVVAGGNHQTNTVGHTLQDPLAARTTDGVGNPVGGVSVSWSVVSGGGSLDRGSSLSDSAGIALAAFTLGRFPGPNMVRASFSGGLVAAEFVATAVAGSPAALGIVFGDGQSEAAGSTLQPFVVSVADSLNNLLPGITVRWSEVEGGGQLNPTTSITDNEGRARATYRLPVLPGEVHVIAEVAGTGLRVVLRATARPSP